MGQEARAEWRPAVGERVDSYHLEEKLGEGGFGAVYRARRGGRLHAVKFLSLAGTDEWGLRELEVLLRLRQVGGVTVEGHGKWPADAPGYLYIAMEYVRGRTLYDWARQENPSARQVAEMLVPLARYLAEVHAEGIVHRDVKGENILVREDGRPALVDFGVGTYEGAPEVTGWRVPGTRSYQSPEAIRFMRQRREAEERYPPTPSDDVWALGVVLYRLLTDALPFSGCYEGELAESILEHSPVPPHVRNRRVPEALGELCMRLLEKEAGARLGEAKALGDALEAALAGADAAWDVPLCEPYAPDNVSTARDRKLALELEAELVRMARLQGYEPRRGPLPPAPESCSEPSPPSVDGSPPEEKEASPASASPRVSAVAWGLVVAVLAVLLGLVALLAVGGSRPDAMASGQEVASRGGPPDGLLGMRKAGLLDEAGVSTRVLLPDQGFTQRPGGVVAVRRAIAYRARRRLAMELEVLNTGGEPWSLARAELVGRDGARLEVLRLWPSEPLLPGPRRQRLFVEAEWEGELPPGPYMLELWNAEGQRSITLQDVLFPQ
ncbi:MAG TPA: DUF2381 family protein [Myxococcaceae bacterium]|nr:DUF2381 family protein [Myxococcaceae bacterium]